MRAPFKIRISIHHVIILLASIGLFSCQKVIDVSLKGSTSKLVIDANISNHPGPYLVTLVQSIDFNQLNNFPPVSGAIVVISDNAGNIDTLKETISGVYKTSTIQGVPDRTYTLTVRVNDKIYSASSTMPPPVDISVLKVTNNIRSTKKIVSIGINDPKGIANYYHIIETFVNKDSINGAPQSTFGKEAIDRLFDGTLMYENLDMLDLTSGDTVLVALQSIDKNIYNYYRSADQGGTLQTVYSNPSTNIIGDALGYFSAYSEKSKQIIVP